MAPPLGIKVGNGIEIGGGINIGELPGTIGPGTPFFVAGSQAEWHANPGIGDSYGEWRNTGTAADNVRLYTHQYTAIDVEFFTDAGRTVPYGLPGDLANAPGNWYFL
jgi:hypothetical protein